MKQLLVLGGGGHARVVLDAARSSGRIVAGVFDDRPGRTGQTIDGFAIVGDYAGFLGKLHTGIEAFVAVGANDVRLRLASEAPAQWATLVHASAYVAPSAVLGVGTVVMAGAVVQPGAVVGDHVVVNTCSSVDHDCVVADGVHIAPGARLCGGVHVGDGALVGAGSVVLPNIRVGAWAVVGAGAMVRDDIPPAETWVGMPAKRRQVST
ncbi:MAG: acetyltransferase [Armatimonadetes bacterium]|nr:acetyltransferase [Armatimonadota bacterium]